jgi:hypothetical protein
LNLREEVSGGWKKLNNEELCNLFASPSIILLNKNEMGRTCSTQGKDYLEDLGIDGKILEWILGKQCESVWTGFIWLRMGTSGGPL